MIGNPDLRYKEIGDNFRTGTRIVTVGDCERNMEHSLIREPAFMDDEAAKAMGIGLKRRVMPITMLLDILVGLLVMAGVIVPPSLFLQMDELKVPNPGYPGDSFMVEGEVINKRETSKGDSFIITSTVFLKNQENVIVVQARLTEMLPKLQES